MRTVRSSRSQVSAPASEAFSARAVTVAVCSLAAGLLLASRWEQTLSASLPQLTLGRLIILLTAVALVLALLSQRRAVWTHLRVSAAALPRSAVLLVLALTGQGAVIVVSIATRGQNSAGAFYGYLEMGLVAALVLCLAQSRPRPRLRLVLLACAAGGGLIGCVDALVTGHLIHALNGASGRLSGHYGNPNLLGFAGSLAVPIFLVFALSTGRARVAWLLAGAVTLVAILLSYSRGAALATGIGIIAAVSFTRAGLRHRLQVAAVGCLLFGIFAAVGYPLYEHLRTRADFAHDAGAGTPDRSGWDPRAEGLIGFGPAAMSNPNNTSLRIVARHAGEGASLPVGRLRAGRRYRLTLTLASPVTGLQASYGLEDNLLGARPATASVLLAPRPHTLHLEWAPTRASPHARLYVWLPAGGDATVSKLSFGPVGARPRPLGLRLLGNANIESASESHFIHSREDAAQLALELFIQKPLTGIGWQRFTNYSAARLHYGRLATHDEYLRYAAELGLPALLFLLLLIATVGNAAIRISPTDVRVAAVPCIVAGAVGLFFVNALETPNISLPLFVSAALICARPVCRDDTPRAG